MQKIILISHKFPPYPGVGSRRWGKLLKYLQHYDLEIFVITNNWGDTGNIYGENIKIIRVHDFFTDHRRNLLVNKLDFLSRKLFSHTDEAFRFNRKAVKIASSLIKKKNIRTVIATSPPYSSAFFAAKLGREFPFVKIIQDFRDAWIDGYFAWNPGRTGSDPVYKKEKEMERFALNNASAVVAVTPGLLERLRKKINNSATITKVITNGFDPADIQPATEKIPAVLLDKSRISIGHFGTLDFGREDEFIQWHKSLSSLGRSLQFILIGNINSILKDYIRGADNIVHIQQLKETELKTFMRHCDLHLVVNDREFYYAFGSKIFDAFQYQKPVIMVSKANEMTELIKENKIGMSTDNSPDENRKLAETLNAIVSHPAILSKLYNYNSFSAGEYKIPFLAKQYYELIKSLN